MVCHDADGKPGYKYSGSGYCYTYDPKSPTERATAMAKAHHQATVLAQAAIAKSMRQS